MDNNKNNNKNQSEIPTPIQPEEVAPDIQSPEEISGSIPPSFPTDVPVYEENNSKVAFIAGIVAFFLIVFGVVFWFFFKDRFFAQPTPVVTKKEPVTLTYWGLWDEEEIFKEVIADYTKQNSHVTIKYEKMAPEQYRERLIARSKTGNGPDLFRFHNTWVPAIREVLKYIPTEIMTNEEFEKTFYPIHVKDLKIEDKIYGIPLMVDSSVLIYNETLLKQAGLTSAPAVWVGESNDMLSAVKTITVKDPQGTIITSGIALGTSSNVSHFGEAFGILLLLNGGDLKKLDAPEAAEALQLYRKFAEDGYWSDAMPNSISAFIEGKTAMILVPSWHIINIKAKNPDLQVKVAPVPKGLNNTSVSIANYWVEGVNSNSKNQLEAWKFLKFMSQKENMAKIYKAQAVNRTFGIAYSRQDMADLLKDNVYLAPVIAAAKSDTLISLPVVARTYDAGLNDDILKYLENAINETAKGVGYQSALDTAAKGITQVFERYKIE